MLEVGSTHINDEWSALNQQHTEYALKMVARLAEMDARVHGVAHRHNFIEAAGANLRTRRNQKVKLLDVVVRKRAPGTRYCSRAVGVNEFDAPPEVAQSVRRTRSHSE